MINANKGRVTIPTDSGVEEETLEIMEYWGADALRDSDGTDFPVKLRNADAKIYSTYYTTRKDNDWARANHDEIQQCYIMTAFYMATEAVLTIPIMKGISDELMEPNSSEDIKRWWEVVDRTAEKVVPASRWSFDKEDNTIEISGCELYHEYTVSFLAYLIWDPVHMYNTVTNDWKDVEHQITFDVRQPKTREFSMKRLRKFLQEHSYVDVVRFTTFFHQFTLIFDELRREKYVDWYGYSASVSPYILKQFEKEVGYKFRAEFIIDQGYYNNQYRNPSREFQDFMDFQRREVAILAKEMVDICHEYGKEAMMFIGDHWIGTEPFMDEFETIGLDAVVGSVGNGSTLRLISDIPGVKYTEGRFLPYFFPDTFYDGGDPVSEAKYNWVTARRAILRKPIQRIGYGGYIKLALDFPEFVVYVKSVCDEFRTLYKNIGETKPHCLKKIAVLNSWGKCRSWGAHMVHHGLYNHLNLSYVGAIETLSGAPFDVCFINFDDIRNNESILDNIDVIINVGSAYTAHSGGENWGDEKVVSCINKFVFNGGGFIGIGEPSAFQKQGKFLQLSSLLGVEIESGFTLGYDKYNWEETPHFITEDCNGEIDFGQCNNNAYALEGTSVIKVINNSVQLSANSFGKGRAVFMSGLPYSFENSRVLHRAVMWSSSSEDDLLAWFSSNYNVEVHAFLAGGKYCVVNNTYVKQTTTVYCDEGRSFDLQLAPNEIKWYEI